MAEIIGVMSWILFGFIWGDWRHWRKYHTTILYFLLLDVLYYYVSTEHHLWSLAPSWPLRSQLVSVGGELIVFISTILIYLGRYPDKRIFSVSWTLLWVAIYTANEWILLLAGTFIYENGWNLGYSCLFNVLMFVMLRLNQQYPLTSYALTVPVGIGFMYINWIPIR